MSKSCSSVGILGGTFDPVHIGHTRLALNLQQALQLDEMRLLPCGIPPHRSPALASNEDRLKMLQLATAATPLKIDPRELGCQQPSYTIDSIKTLRKELGEEASLVLCMGMDAFATLDQWQQWQELRDHCHIVAANRPAQVSKLSPSFFSWLSTYQVDTPLQLQQKPSGSIYLAQLEEIPVSSTLVRQHLYEGKMPDTVHPDVLAYIQKRGLYSE